MSSIAPFLLLPEFVERPWGTRDLALVYPHKAARRGGEFEGPIGEVWLTGDMCRVATGPHQGRTLGDLTREFGRDLTGTNAPLEAEFPLLAKFLFTREKLSVQVHPDDSIARLHGLPHGKSECWYVFAAEPGAKVALGLDPARVPAGTYKEKTTAAMAAGTLEELLDWVDVRAGELISVPAGTLHSIGPGCLLVEVQQNSDVTYRLFDYGRARELNIAEGLAAMKEPSGAGKIERQSGPKSFGSVARLITTPQFVVEKYVVREEATFPGGANAGPEHSSVQVLIGLEGCGMLEVPGGPSLTLAKGECAVLPAGVREFRIKPQWALECLCAWVPPAK